MILTEQETMLLNDLKQQEELCRDKYAFYSSEAKDPELKQLFEVIQKEEAEHYDTISSLLSGDTPDVGIAAPKNYQPKAAYHASSENADKKHDALLCSDSISSEKYVSSTYNNDLFSFASPKVRQILNHIQTEEQQHAEMIYRYKTANQMAYPAAALQLSKGIGTGNFSAPMPFMLFILIIYFRCSRFLHFISYIRSSAQLIYCSMDASVSGSFW